MLSFEIALKINRVVGCLDRSSSQIGSYEKNLWILPSVGFCYIIESGLSIYLF